MKKQSLILLVSLVLFAACAGGDTSPTGSQNRVPTPTKAWYAGGTLHAATVQQWNAASYANQLATSADWVNALVRWTTLDEVRFKAEELVDCINEVGSAPPEQRVDELAAACAVLMDWNRK